jgi:UDP-N-acetylmuramoylalanine--D-glutamate ligase
MIFNVDYPILLAVARSSKAKKFFISRKQVLKKGPGLFVKDKKIWMLDESGSMTEVMSVDEVKIRGEHNLENVLPAIAVGSKLGVDQADIRKTVGQFKGLPHRLQLVGKIDNVEFYNDSIATIPEAVIAAIKSFEGPLAIILGGSSKGSKFDQLAKAIERRPQTYAVLMGATSSTIAQNLEKHARKVSYKFAQNMTQAVEKAHQFVKQTGGVVLLSPACASFDMYANFQKRGEDFEKQVKNIK